MEFLFLYLGLFYKNVDFHTSIFNFYKMVCPTKMWIFTHRNNYCTVRFFISITWSILLKCGFSHIETTTVLSDFLFL